MKKLLVLTLFLAVHICKAQFIFAGKILNARTSDTLTLNIPFIYGTDPNRNTTIVTDNQGNFSVKLPLPEKKFATLTFQDKKYLLLLTPGKKLSISLSAIDTTIRKFTGPAAKENNLLYNLKLTEIPSFKKAGKENTYKNLKVDELLEKLVKPYLLNRDRLLMEIDQSKSLSRENKLLIRQEVQANALINLTAFARETLRMKRDDLMDFMIKLYQDISIEPEILPAGPRFYELAEAYVGYMEAAAFKDFQKKGSNPKVPLRYYNLSLDSANKLVAERGKMFMNWVAIRNNFHPKLAESLLAQAIAEKCDQKLLTEAQPLMNEYRILYSQGAYSKILRDSLDRLELSLAKNRDSKGIEILPEYREISSIYQVVNKYKGKMIYLDIWGTWCAPCREELKFVPQLKQHFKGRDVVYIYVDMDDNSKDSLWREFLYVNNLEGIHLRKDGNEVKPFWDELQPEKNLQGRYPSYFIFDKNGKLIPEEAKRPSDETKLYVQIEKYL